MSRVVVVEIEVEEEDTKGVISEIAADLSPYTILSIGFKRPEVQLHKPGYRDAAGERSLIEDTQRVARQGARNIQ